MTPKALEVLGMYAYNLHLAEEQLAQAQAAVKNLEQRILLLEMDNAGLRASLEVFCPRNEILVGPASSSDVSPET